MPSWSPWLEDEDVAGPTTASSSPSQGASSTAPASLASFSPGTLPIASPPAVRSTLGCLTDTAAVTSAVATCSPPALLDVAGDTGCATVLRCSVGSTVVTCWSFSPLLIATGDGGCANVLGPSVGSAAVSCWSCWSLWTCSSASGRGEVASAQEGRSLGFSGSSASHFHLSSNLAVAEFHTHALSSGMSPSWPTQPAPPSSSSRILMPRGRGGGAGGSRDSAST